MWKPWKRIDVSTTISISCLEQIFLFILSFPQEIPDVQIGFMASSSFPNPWFELLFLNCRVSVGSYMTEAGKRQNEILLRCDIWIHVHVRLESILFNGVVLCRVYPGTLWGKQGHDSLPLANEPNAGATSVCFPPGPLGPFSTGTPQRMTFLEVVTVTMILSRCWGYRGENYSCLLSYWLMMREPQLWLRARIV